MSKWVVEGDYLQVCQHAWEVWDEGEYRQHRRCRNCPSEQWRDSLLPKTTRDWIAHIP